MASQTWLLIAAVAAATIGIAAWSSWRLSRLATKGSQPMGLLDHLRELRFRLITTFASVILASVLLLSLDVRWTGDPYASAPYPIPSVYDSIASRMVKALLSVTIPDGVTISVITPYESATTLLLASIIGGLLLASPIVAYQILAFLLPALTTRERRVLFALLVPAVLLFLAGAALALLVIVPISLQFLYSFSGAIGAGAIARPVDVLKFAAVVVLLMGAAFQTPLAMGVLARYRVVPVRRMARAWRILLVVSLLVGGMMPDPSILTQLLVAVPLFGLYLAGLLVAWALQPRATAG